MLFPIFQTWIRYLSRMNWQRQYQLHGFYWQYFLWRSSMMRTTKQCCIIARSTMNGEHFLKENVMDLAYVSIYYTIVYFNTPRTLFSSWTYLKQYLFDMYRVVMETNNSSIVTNITICTQSSWWAYLLGPSNHGCQSLKILYLFQLNSKVLYNKLTNYHLEILSCQYRDQVWNWYEYMGILSHVKDFDARISHIQSLASQITSRPFEMAEYISLWFWKWVSLWNLMSINWPYTEQSRPAGLWVTEVRKHMPYV